MRWFHENIVKPWHPTLIGIVVVSSILYVLLPLTSSHEGSDWGRGFLHRPDRKYTVTERGFIYLVVEERRIRMLPFSEWEFSCKVSSRCVPTFGEEKRTRYGIIETTDYKWKYPVFR
jgi:hypothetical protein